jgi:hypothetical protein
VAVLAYNCFNKEIAMLQVCSSRGDHNRTNPKVKPQTEPIQTENRKNRIWFGCIWMTFLLNRKPQNREP